MQSFDFVFTRTNCEIQSVLHRQSFWESVFQPIAAYGACPDVAFFKCLTAVCAVCNNQLRRCIIVFVSARSSSIEERERETVWESPLRCLFSSVFASPCPLGWVSSKGRCWQMVKPRNGSVMSQYEYGMLSKPQHNKMNVLGRALEEMFTLTVVLSTLMDIRRERRYQCLLSLSRKI